MYIAVDWGAKPVKATNQSIKLSNNQSIDRSTKQSIALANTAKNNGMGTTMDFYFNDLKTQAILS